MSKINKNRIFDQQQVVPSYESLNGILNWVKEQRRENLVVINQIPFNESKEWSFFKLNFRVSPICPKI